MKRILVIIILLLAVVAAYAEETVDFQLADLEGDWEGTGTFVMPVTGIEMDIDGKANFQYVTDQNYLRTQLIGEKFMFTYSDSGHLAMDRQGDSLTWEVWDNLGRHASYRGMKDGGRILGERIYRGKLYSVAINMISADSISFRLTTTDDDGASVDKARFALWRVK